jgi:hypothetical protein
MHSRKVNVHLDLSQYDDGEVRPRVSVSRVFIAAQRWVQPPGPAGPMINSAVPINGHFAKMTGFREGSTYLRVLGRLRCPLAVTGTPKILATRPPGRSFFPRGPTRPEIPSCDGRASSNSADLRPRVSGTVFQPWSTSWVKSYGLSRSLNLNGPVSFKRRALYTRAYSRPGRVPPASRAANNSKDGWN